MIFRIDCKPLTSNIFMSVDYASKIVYSAVSSHLIKYNFKHKDYIFNDCEKFEIYEDMTFRMILRKDIFYYDGTNVTAKDYVSYIKFLMTQKCLIGMFLSDIDDVKYIDKYKFDIKLKCKNKNFKYILSFYQLSPVKSFNITCGPYYISNNSRYKIHLKRNQYYRNKCHFVCNNDLTFSVSKNFKKDVKYFLNDELDITNNTMFPYNKIKNFNELNIYPSFIFMCLEFSNKLLRDDFLKLREAIYFGINREEIVRRLFGYVSSALDFNLNMNDCSNYFFHRICNFININLTMGYDLFYPNEIVAKIIQSQLSEININIMLVKNKYAEKNQNDINLKLIYPLYINNMAFYNSPYFYLLSKVTKNEEFLSNYDLIKNDKLTKKQIINIFNKTFPIIPIIKMNSIYLAKDNVKNFNFLECDFSVL